MHFRSSILWCVFWFSRIGGEKSKSMSVYSIKDLEYLSGIKAHTIRIWEKRYQLLNPDRSETNIRSYSDEDVRKVMNVALLVKNGYKISNVAGFDDEKLQVEVLRINRFATQPEKNIDQLMIHAVNLDSVEFEYCLDRIIEEQGFTKTIQQVIFPFFERIGILWQAGSVFTAQEHFVSNSIRNRLIREAGKVEIQSDAQSILFFLPENEWHELGLLFFNYLAALSGLRCIYLGQSLPFADLSNFLTNKYFDFVCTAFIQTVEKPELEQYLATLSVLFPESKILVSGRQIALNKPKLPENVLAVKNGNDFIRKISG